MSEPVRQSPLDPRAAGVGAPAGREVSHEDPLEELARILGEGVAHPVRPENVVDVGRRANPTRPMPQQLSELEAALFEELRASVTPQERVRGNFTREVTPVIPQHPVDDHDIASLRGYPADEGPILAAVTGAAPAGPGATTSGATELPLSDYYAYDDAYGEAIGNVDAEGYSPYGDLDAAFAAAAAGRSAQALRPTFADFDPQAIAVAARETEPSLAPDLTYVPHSAEELDAVRRQPRRRSRTGFGLAAALVGVVLAGGGGLAAWKTWGDLVPGGGPVLVRADGKPLKALPDPTKAPPVDAEPTLVRDTAVNGSKIVSRQEDPVDQVSGRTPEGREVRVINPGAQRPSSADVPHAVKTVVVRPDGSIVSDGDKLRSTVAPSVPGVPAPPAAVMPPAEPQTPSVAVKTTAVGAGPSPGAVPPVAVPALPQPVPVNVPLPVAAPPPPAQSAAPPAAPVKTVTTTPVAPAASAPAPAPVKTVTTTTVTPPAAPSGGAPLSLGPVGPKLASAPPAAAPKPVPAAPAAPAAAAPVSLAPPPAAAAAPVTLAPAAAASGEWAVQISASKSDAEARKSFADAQHRHSALAGRSLDVQRADLGDKGTFYRARVVAGTREQASALCGQIQAQGGQCMVVRR